MTLIWATRGRTWGFRFLRNGGLKDPLPVYDNAFSSLGDEVEAWRRTADTVALRFPDPEARQDAAGRVILHEFVVIGRRGDGITSVASGRALVWPLVQADFGRVWHLDEPPAVHD